MPRLHQLAPELRRVVQRHFPDWTDRGDSDPGVTLLELFAFVAEELLHRANQIPERSQPHLVTLISQLSRLLVFTDGFAVSVDGQPWRPAPDFTHAGPQDPVYVLDRLAGLITFGDGKSGRRPPNGSSVTARYRSGAAGDGIA
ncbi:MAG TPA: hypothetical protein VFO18_02835, partial [Methylomirabilota bacterium]|nr:hypothetical protein [Methylomirabilota bacterium]